VEWGGFEEVTKDGGVIGVVGQVVGDPVVEFQSVLVTDVCKFGAFERTPEVFDGVEFRCVRRQVVDREARMFGEEIADDFGPMMTAAIPDHDHVAAKVTKKITKEQSRSRAVVAGVGNRLEE
jgi:hypothetical protein